MSQPVASAIHGHVWLGSVTNDANQYRNLQTAVGGESESMTSLVFFFFLSVRGNRAAGQELERIRQDGRGMQCRFRSPVFTFKQRRDVIITAASSAAQVGPRLYITDL